LISFVSFIFFVYLRTIKTKQIDSQQLDLRPSSDLKYWSFTRENFLLASAPKVEPGIIDRGGEESGSVLVAEERGEKRLNECLRSLLADVPTIEQGVDKINC